ncbi:MAG TPA: NAD(P)-dependent oxidoreductase [Candidatus Baltobacteraceae bacterium]|nr:NAD(P)-dependent oxidoreductase [Candidatus Baltobacteraceae bacterium]
MGESIGLIGIGLVGTALAENLVAAGFDVGGFARSTASRDALSRCGGRAVPSARGVGEMAERVILSLPDSSAVEDVVLGPEGLLAGTSRVRLILDTTTGDPERTEALAARLAGRGIHLLDAPISGSSQQIRERQGVFLIGGERDVYERSLDLIGPLADRYYFLGGSGSGARAKLATNLILGLNRLVLAEGLVFAERLGLDLEAFLALLKVTPAYSCAVDVKGQKMLRGDFSPQSKIAQHHKDLRIILDYAERLGQDLPLARVHETILARGMAVGEGDLDTSAVIRQLRALRQEGRHVH